MQIGISLDLVDNGKKNIPGCEMKELFIILVLFFAFSSCERSNYQMVSIGNGNIAVIDTRTGEVWMSEANESIYTGKLTTPTLRPREYSFMQCKEEGYADRKYIYTPEKSRNEQNSSWQEWFRRFFAKI